ncbi:MAG: AI-2E family transporter [Kiritimatiellia bacterium]|jgi:predicted PurR-regulated permease PerM
MNIPFSSRQTQVITTSVTIVLLLLALASGWFILTRLIAFLGKHSNVLLPPVVAIVLAMVLKPLYLWMERFFRGHRIPAVTATIIVAFIPVVLFLWLCGNLLANQGLRFLEYLPTLQANVENFFARRFPEVNAFIEANGYRAFFLKFLNLQEWIGVLRPAGGTAMTIGSHVLRTVSSFLGWIVLPVYTACFLATSPLGGKDVSRLLAFISDSAIRSRIAYLVDTFLECIVVFFRGQILVAFIQGVLFGIGFQVVGLSYGFFVGFLLGILNIVPYLGNILGLSITIPLAWIGPGGSFLLVLKVIAVFCAVQMLESYVITPRVMGNRTGLSSAGIIFSLFFWSSVIGGILGVILAIPLSAFLVAVWRTLFGRNMAPPPESGDRPPAGDAPDASA